MSIGDPSKWYYGWEWGLINILSNFSLLFSQYQCKVPIEPFNTLLGIYEVISKGFTLSELRLLPFGLLTVKIVLLAFGFSP